MINSAHLYVMGSLNSTKQYILNFDSWSQNGQAYLDIY